MRSVHSLWEIATKTKLYPFQSDLLFQRGKKLIVNKSRQLGISSVLAFDSLLRAMRGETVLVVSPSERQSINFYTYAQNYYLSLASFIRCTNLSKNSIGFMQFYNGGRLISLPNNPATIRGLTVGTKGRIIIDEFAFFENPLEIWQAILPMITRGGSIAIISTPNGDANLYSDFWRDGEKLGFKKILINYKECQDFTPAKIAFLKESLDDLSWRQEYENFFLGSALGYFPMDLIQKCVSKDLQVWNFPEDVESPQGLFYAVDVGRKRDKSAIIGIDSKWKVQFVQSFGNMPFSEQKEFFAKLIPSALEIYFDATGIGAMLGEELRKLSSKFRPVDITNDMKLKGFVELKKLMEEGVLKLPDNRELIRALNLIERKQSGTTITFDAPRTDATGHSDVAFCLMLLAYHLRRPKASFIVR